MKNLEPSHVVGAAFILAGAILSWLGITLLFGLVMIFTGFWLWRHRP